MKISWGTGIAVLYITFMVVVLGTVAFSTTQNNDLVTEDYYEKELEYQNQLDKMNRSNALPEQLTVVVDKGGVKITYPSIFEPEFIKGDVVFYRPSSENEDFKIPVAPDVNGIQFIETASISKGLWEVKIDWQAKGNEYYNKKLLMVN